MPRIRTIKPDAFLSESLSDVPRGTRWTFAGLWTFADDKGRARDDARLIKAALYPLDDDTSLADVAHDLELLADCGGICRYEVDGKRYLHMPTWEDHQRINRPTPAKHPECPKHDGSGTTQAADPDPSLSAHGDLSESSTWEGKGRERDKEGDKEGDKGRGGSATEPHDAASGRSLALVSEARPEVERVCDHLADRIEANGSRRPTIGPKWRDAARLMLDRDGRTEQEIHGAIDWCQADEFWRANVMSLPKLREKYDQLRLQAQRRQADPRQRQTDDLFARAANRMGVHQ
jgi:hypothetical protein